MENNVNQLHGKFRWASFLIKRSDGRHIPVSIYIYVEKWQVKFTRIKNYTKIYQKNIFFWGFSEFILITTNFTSTA